MFLGSSVGCRALLFSRFLRHSPRHVSEGNLVNTYERTFKTKQNKHDDYGNDISRKPGLMVLV